MRRDLAMLLVAVLAMPGLRAAEPGPGPVPAAVAAGDVAGRTHALLVQAQAGVLAAGASLLHQGLVEELALVDPQLPGVAAWSAPQAVGGFSSQQLYGVVLENWAAANPTRLGRWAQATELRARTFLSAAYTEEPLILLESALSFSAHEPSDLPRARELFLQALLMAPDDGLDAVERLAVTRLAAQVAVRCGWPESHALLARLAAQSAGVHDPFWQARAAWVQAEAARAASDPDQLALALSTDAQAAAWAEQAHDPYGQAHSLVEQAACELLAEHSVAARQRAGACDARAATLFATAQLPECSALALRDEALCQRPDCGGDGGSWPLATELAVAAAGQFAAAGDWPNQADALADAARSAAQNDPARSTMASRQLLREAEHAYRQLHADDQADALLEWFNPEPEGP